MTGGGPGGGGVAWWRVPGLDLGLAGPIWVLAGWSLAWLLCLLRGEAELQLGQGRQRRRRADCSAKAGTLWVLEIPSGPMQPRAWYVPAIASGQLPSLTVEVGPSPVPTVLLP